MRARTKSTVLRAVWKLRSPPTTSEHEPVWPNLWGSNAQLYGLGPRFCARLVGFWLKVLTASTCIRQDISALHGNILVMIHERNYQHLSTTKQIKCVASPLTQQDHVRTEQPTRLRGTTSMVAPSSISTCHIAQSPTIDCNPRPSWRLSF